MISATGFSGWRVFDKKASGRNKTIRVNPREIFILSEVAYDSKRVFEAGVSFG